MKIRAIWLSVAIIAGLVSVASHGAEPLSGRQAKEAAAKAFNSGDFDQFYAIELRFAERGEALAQFYIALTLLDGKLTTLPNAAQQTRGLEWLRRAAHQGLSQALIRLEFIYASGLHGVVPDMELAECYRNAASKISDVARCAELEHAKGFR